jgi:heme exporter protein B
MMRALLATLRREFWLAARSKADWLMPPLFFVIVVTLFGLGAKPNDPTLGSFAPAILWVGALLSSLLGLERLFRGDYEDGSLEQVFAADAALPVVLAKLFVHWLLSGLPLALLAAPLALQLGMGAQAVPALLMGLLLGTPILSLIGGFAAALTLGLARAGALIPILVLPMIAPVVIFGAGAARSAAAGLDPAGPLYFLAAVLMLAATFLPWATAAALRHTFE